MLDVSSDMIFKSIKWRLQIWYGLILVGVLAGFGFTSYQLERGKLFRRVDEGLQRRAVAIANALRPLRPQFPGDRPPGEPGPQRPLLDRRPERPPPEQRFKPPIGEDAPDRLPPVDEIRTRIERSDLFDETEVGGFYYVVSFPDGNVLRSKNAPVHESSFGVNGPGVRTVPERATPTRPLDRKLLRMRGQYHAVFHLGPAGSEILVGRLITRELKELNLTALRLTGIGACILLLGLAGGWWIASRAMRPIEDISATATKISSGDLSQRINVAHTEDELGQLAGTLNSTFSRLEAAFGQQRQFTADAAHELRTPVAVILTETQTTLKRERSAEEYRQSVEVCQRITQRMRRLIESLFQLARLDAGQEQLKRMQFDLSGTAKECLELVGPLAEERGVKIHCELPSLECVGDPERISQVITNLLTNAVQYNKPDGEVRVNGRQENGMAVLTVADTGPGISAEDLPRVFERFYRAEKSRSSGNAGLGLSICKAIVEAHGGTIEVSSEPGSGTTFMVRLPTRA